MDVVYEEVSSFYVDQRIGLSDPSGIQLGDRLQRNGDPIVEIEEHESHYMVSTKNEKATLPRHQPIFVWRIKDCGEAD